MNLESVALDVSSHAARLDGHEKRHDQQDAGLVRLEDKLERVSTMVLTGLIAAIGGLVAGLLNLVKH